MWGRLASAVREVEVKYRSIRCHSDARAKRDRRNPLFAGSISAARHSRFLDGFAVSE
jgi:hypothetical protein